MTTASKTKSWCTRQMCCHVGVHRVWRAFVQFTASAFNDWHLQLETGCGWVGAGLNFPQKCLTQSSKKKRNHPQSGPCLANKHIIISIVVTIIPWCNACRTFILEIGAGSLLGHAVIQWWKNVIPKMSPLRQGRDKTERNRVHSGAKNVLWSPSKELWASDPISSCPS